MNRAGGLNVSPAVHPQVRAPLVIGITSSCSVCILIHELHVLEPLYHVLELQHRLNSKW